MMMVMMTDERQVQMDHTQNDTTSVDDVTATLTSINDLRARASYTTRQNSYAQRRPRQLVKDLDTEKTRSSAVAERSRAASCH